MSRIRVDWEDPEVTEEQVEEVLNNLRRQGSPWEPVERAVQLGDLLTVDMHGYVDEDPEEQAESEDSDDGDADTDPMNSRSRPLKPILIRNPVMVMNPRVGRKYRGGGRSWRRQASATWCRRA